MKFYETWYAAICGIKTYVTHCKLVKYAGFLQRGDLTFSSKLRITPFLQHIGIMFSLLDIERLYIYYVLFYLTYYKAIQSQIL